MLLEGAGAQVRYVDREKLAGASVTASVLILLGSDRSAHDPVQAPVVRAEVDLPGVRDRLHGQGLGRLWVGVLQLETVTLDRLDVGAAADEHSRLVPHQATI